MNPFAKPPTISDDFRSTDLYREAADIFFEKGFAATTMADIAEAVDLTRGGLYYYIQGKKALLFAIMNYGLDLLETEVVGPARRLDDPGECLRELIGGFLDLIAEEGSVMGLLADEEDQLEPAHRTKVQSRKRLFADFLRDAFAALSIGSSRADGLEPARVAENAITLMSSARGWNMKASLGRNELMEEIIERSQQGSSPTTAEATPT